MKRSLPSRKQHHAGQQHKNSIGSSRQASHRVIATPSSAKAINMVFSPAIAIGNKAEQRSRQAIGKRSIVSASGQRGHAEHHRLTDAETSAKTAICDVTISPEVDIIAIMANISQKSGWRSISREVNCRLLCATVWLAGNAPLSGGSFSPSLARNPTVAKRRPKTVMVVLIRIDPARRRQERWS